MDEQLDANLMQAIATQRDRNAFSQLCERVRHRAYTCAYRILRNSALAEDAVQEAMLSIWLAKSAQPTGSVEHWIMSIVVHKSIDLRRSHRQSAMREERVAMERRGSGRMSREQAVAGEEIEREELVSALRKHIDQLPELESQLLTCCYGANMPHQKIAELFDMSRSHVTEKIQQALARLKSNLSRAGVAAVVPLLSTEALSEAVRVGYECPPGVTEKILSRLDSAGSQAAKALSRRALRVARAGKSASWIPMAAGALVVAAAAGTYVYTQSSPAPAPVQQSSVPAPLPASAPAPVVAPPAPAKTGTVQHWDFDRGIGTDLIARPEWSKSKEFLPNVPLPEWVADAGVKNSGALKFPAGGAALFLKSGLPTTNLPIRFEFDLRLVDRDSASIGIRSGRIPDVSNRLAHALKFEKVNGAVAWKTNGWMHVVRSVEESHGIVTTRTLYDGVISGDYLEESKDPAWTDPQSKEFYEIYGKNLIIDNLTVTVGEP
jgi:RNA polymerase sigma-70 factor (ECF subfamily)